MPNGYTHNISKGITFKEFALDCSRAFGALIHMRDMPHDAEIPDEIKPNIEYYDKNIDDSKKELDKISKMSIDEKKKIFNTYLRKVKKENEKRVEETNSLKEKYVNILEKVKSWMPPTKDHIGLKDFMIKQITSSIDFDCDRIYQETVFESCEEYFEEKVNSCKHNIEFYTKGKEKEIDGCKKRTEWIQALKKSLED